MRIKLVHKYENIINIENLLLAWQEFIKGKKNRHDVQEFELRLADNIIKLHHELKNFKYQHGKYQAFNINDPKPRNIHKASVRDRLVHDAIYRILYPFFEKSFISDSFSSRELKGTHKAIDRFRTFCRKVSRNNTLTCWVLKCDIRKFFENIDHNILIEIIEKYINDKDIVNLLSKIIHSFHSKNGEIGLPLGNLTSQLLVNIYMNEFDQYIKHRLKVKYYVRYADDFVILSQNHEWLEELIPEVKNFLWSRLKLQLHPDKIFIKTLASGVDFLGWVHFPDHRILRTVTKKRMFRKLRKDKRSEVINSYLGLLKHGNTCKLNEKVINESKLVYD